MKDADKTREQLINEIIQLRQQNVILKNDLLPTTHQQLLAIIEFLPDATLVIDRDKKVIAWNRAMEELTGVAKDDLIGRGDYAYAVPFYGRRRPMLIDLINLDQPERYTMKYYNFERRGDTLSARGFMSLPYSGVKAFLWSKASLLYDSSGNVIGAIQSIRDMTAQKIMEDELKTQHNCLEEKVKERTEELVILNEQLKKEIAAREDVAKQLKEKLHFFQLLIDTIPNPIFYKDVNGLYQGCNKAFETFCGYNRELIVGRTVFDIFPFELSSKYNEMDQLLFREPGVQVYESVVRHAGGTNYDVIFNRATYLSTEGNIAGVVGVIIDITEQKKAQASLRRAEQDKALILDNILERVVYHDLDMRIIWANKSAGDSVGLSPEQLTGLYCHQVWLQQNSPCSECPLLDVLSSGEPREGEITSLDGRVWLVRGYPVRDQDGKVTGVVQVTLEITLRKKADEELRMSRERFARAFNASPSPMSIHRLEDGEIIDVNNAFLKGTGYQREEVTGRIPVKFNICVDISQLDRVKELLLKQGSVSNLEMNILTKSGEIRTVLMSAEIIELKGERCVLTASNDITELKQYERKIALLDRLNLVGQMAAGIGHEIRNPMTTVRGFLQFLEGKEECANYSQYFNLMINELDRANSIITEFLYLAKDKAINLRLQNLNAIINSLYPLLNADAVMQNKNTRLVLDEIPDLLLDGKEIRQVLHNLIRNGLEAMSTGGTVTIKTFVEDEEVVLAVQDEGQGIDPELLDKLGTPFITTKETGTGLGLAVCYSIANRHKASIKVRTGPGGTTVSVRFAIKHHETVGTDAFH